MARSRSYTAFNMVTLPQLGANAAIALVTQILFIAATMIGLSTPIIDALKNLRERLRSLKQAASKQRIATGESTSRAQLADRVVDAAWRSMFLWLDALATRPDGGGDAVIASAIRGRLFPEGLRFTQLPYKLEWSESESRLDQIGDEGLEQKIEELGGAKFLEAVRSAHRAYGDALGLTEIVDSVATAPSLREPLDEVQHELRKFVIQVAASVRDDDAESAAIADRLLAPIDEWRARRSSPPPPPEAPEPAPPSTPA